MSLREVLNFAAFIMLLLGILTGMFLLNDLVKHRALDWAEAGFVVFSLTPFILALVTSQAYGIAFVTAFYTGGDRASARHFSQEKAWAREGRGQEVAHAMLWRDRLVGDRRGLIAILEMAAIDPDMKDEAVRAGTRLLGSRGLSKAERDHIGRLFQQARVSTVRETYPG